MMHDAHVVMLPWTISHALQLDNHTAKDWNYFYGKQDRYGTKNTKKHTHVLQQFMFVK